VSNWNWMLTVNTLRHNYTVNILDGAFFGFALGFASFVTILPLFVSRFTDSAILIGLVPVLHVAGIQLPQLFIADFVSRQPRHKPLVLWMTIHERVPFLLMAGLAWFSTSLSPALVLAFTFLLLTWQGFGAGFTANSWQNLIAKIIPNQQRGTFFGLQGAAMNVLFGIGAVISGVILERLDSPLDFALCFLIAGGFLVISFVALALTKEEAEQPHQTHTDWRVFMKSLASILRQDRNFGWFLAGRTLTQFATMASAFYIIYGVKELGMSEATAGLMTGVLAVSQIAANPLLGWLGDKIGHQRMLILGAGGATLSAVVAWLAPSAEWFFLVFILVGISNVAAWTIAMSITLEFGSETQRASYIGLANTLIAPAAIAAPLFGGWLADQAGFLTTFWVSALFGVLTVGVFSYLMREPRKESPGRDL
jgi:MFS family permease